MKNTFIADLIPGMAVDTTFLLQSKEHKISRNGKTYLDLDLRDSSGIIRARLRGSDDVELDFETDDIVAVQGEVEEFQGTCQILVRKIAKYDAEEINLLDYLPRTRQDPEALYAALVARCQRLSERALRSLILSVLEDPEIAPKFKLAPAATSYHHAFLGGLLEHVISLVRLGDRVCDHYPFLTRDLVIAGLVLHDLGKIDELSFQRAFRYSTRGHLVGHITIALDIIQAKIRAIPDFPDRLKDQIEHLVLSHHGRLEWGSPKEPMFPEALAVHYLDDLDSKLESMRAQYATDRHKCGDWTSRNRALGRELYKVGYESLKVEGQGTKGEG
jgi:3'-5' exoribonuclease